VPPSAWLSHARRAARSPRCSWRSPRSRARSPPRRRACAWTGTPLAPGRLASEGARLAVTPGPCRQGDLLRGALHLNTCHHHGLELGLEFVLVRFEPRALALDAHKPIRGSTPGGAAGRDGTPPPGRPMAMRSSTDALEGSKLMRTRGGPPHPAGVGPEMAPPSPGRQPPSPRPKVGMGYQPPSLWPIGP
jgi:hypothetical protein